MSDLYHGSPEVNIVRFHPSTEAGKISTVFGTEHVKRHGIFLTPSQTVASDYAGEHGRVYKTAVSTKNPFDMRNGVTEKMEQDFVNAGGSTRWLYNHEQPWEKLDGESGKAFVDTLKHAGYDSYIYHETSPHDGTHHETHVVFDPEHVAIKEDKSSFSDWFGDSKTVNGDGTPTVFYHGTSSDVDEFKHVHGGNQWGRGHYFISSPTIASQYATGETTGAHARISPEGNAAPNVIPVHLKMEKPFVMDAPLDVGIVRHAEKNLGYSLKDNLWRGMKNRDFHQMLWTGHHQSIDHTNQFLRSVGYDGIRERSPDSIHMVFDPAHIKSSIGNSGEYSINSRKLVEWNLQQFIQEAKQGDYVSVDATIPEEIIQAVKDAKFDGGEVIDVNDLHATLVYSVGTMVDHDVIAKKLQKYDLPIEGKVTQLTRFDDLPKEGERDTSLCTIVMEVDAPELIKIHKFLKKLGLNHSYDDYRPHVSLVYDLPIVEAKEKMKSLESVTIGRSIKFTKFTVNKLK